MEISKPNPNFIQTQNREEHEEKIIQNDEYDELTKTTFQIKSINLN